MLLSASILFAVSSRAARQHLLHCSVQIGFMGPAFFLTQLSKVTTAGQAVGCMMACQGLDAFSQSGLYSNHQVSFPTCLVPTYYPLVLSVVLMGAQQCKLWAEVRTEISAAEALFASCREGCAGSH